MEARQTLIESIVALGTKAFDPRAAAKDAHKREFDDLIGKTRTIAIMSVLNTLIRPGRVPSWLSSHLMQVLILLPLRPDGVRATLEFVIAAHPSSAVGAVEASVPQKRGANITQEALSMAAKLLATPPATVPAQQWFAGISSQLLALLDGGDGDELIKAAAYVIGFGILGRRKFGAPGEPGWIAVIEPVLRCIDPSQGTETSTTAVPNDKDEILDLTKDTILVRSNDLSRALQRLQGLITSHPNPGLTRRLLGPLLFPLWALSSWPGASASSEDKYSLPARNLLRIYLRLSSSSDNLNMIIRNLLYNGPRDASKIRWAYRQSASGAIEVVAASTMLKGEGLSHLNWSDIGTKSDAFADLLATTFTEDDISATFLGLFSHWMAAKSAADNSGISLKEKESDPEIQLMETSVLQKMMEKYPEKLTSRSEHILKLVEEILGQSRTVTGKDEAVPVALSLLNLVITSPGFQKPKVNSEVLQSIEASLDHLSKGVESETALTARNLSIFLKIKDEMEDQSVQASAPTDRQVEDRKTYNLALSYITEADSPPPVRSEGLNLIQGLIQSSSPILDIPAVLVLMSSLLDENEDFINLRVVKIFTQLAVKHPKSVTKQILEHYLDTSESTAVDTRLRFGEALLQVIERLGETFTGETAQQVGEALLLTAGRRAHRPKTAAKQEKDERLREMKQQNGEEPVDDTPDSEDDISGEEKAQNDILKKIVEGWGSKQGAEDVRVRASALSVFAAGIETNVAGLGSTLLATAVDLCVNILAIEPDMEKGILRRAAVILILSFVKALNTAKQTGRRLGFGLTHQSQEDILGILQYVAATDNDGLVKQHAQDVAESLENWKMLSLVPEAAQQGESLTKLAGLTVNPDSASRAAGKPRPVIEEVE